jgi:ribonuclease HI
MGYILVFKVDGGCRRNGQPGSIGAAAAVRLRKTGDHWATWASELPQETSPTNQQAEITAIIIALQQTLKIYDELNREPLLDVTIMSDSKYAVRCMNEWIYKWTTNGWMNAAGREVVNRDLITQASVLDHEVKELGTVVYKFIPRSENDLADNACNNTMNRMEDSS